MQKSRVIKKKLHKSNLYQSKGYGILHRLDKTFFFSIIIFFKILKGGIYEKSNFINDGDKFYLLK